MNFNSPVTYLFLLTIFCMALVIWMWWYTDRKRKKIIREGHLVTGKVLKTEKLTVGKGNKIARTEIEYKTETGETLVTINILPFKLSRYTTDSRVELFYRKQDPRKIIIRDDRYISKFRNVVLLISLLLLTIIAITLGFNL
jgi:hypothetical protein